MLWTMSSSEVPPEIPASDGAAEERIAAQNARISIDLDRKARASRRVPGRVDAGHANRSRAQHERILEIAVERRRRKRDREADPAPLFRQLRIQRTVAGMQQAFAADTFAQHAERADVIEMRMRVHEIFRTKLVLFEKARDPLDVVTAVDDDRFTRCFVTEDAAIAPERSDRKVQRDHGMSIPKSR